MRVKSGIKRRIEGHLVKLGRMAENRELRGACERIGWAAIHVEGVKGMC